MGRLGVQKGASQGEPKGSADGEAALPRSPPPPPPRSSVASRPGLFPRWPGSRRKPSGGLCTPPPSFPGRKSPEGPSQGAPRTVRTASGWGSPGGAWGAGSSGDSRAEPCQACGLECGPSRSSTVSTHLVSQPCPPRPQTRRSAAAAHEVSVCRPGRGRRSRSPGGVCDLRGGVGSGSWRGRPQAAGQGPEEETLKPAQDQGGGAGGRRWGTGLRGRRGQPPGGWGCGWGWQEARWRSQWSCPLSLCPSRPSLGTWARPPDQPVGLDSVGTGSGLGFRPSGHAQLPWHLPQPHAHCLTRVWLAGPGDRSHGHCQLGLPGPGGTLSPGASRLWSWLLCACLMHSGVRQLRLGSRGEATGRPPWFPLLLSLVPSLPCPGRLWRRGLIGKALPESVLGTPPLRRPPGSERENQGLGRIRDPGAHCQEACLPACPGSGGSLTIAKRLPCARLAL